MTTQEEMEEVNGILGSVIDELVPIHTTSAAFEKGGVECRKFIEVLYDRLLKVEQIIDESNFDDGDDEFGAGYEEWRREHEKKQKEQSA